MNAARGVRLFAVLALLLGLFPFALQAQNLNNDISVRMTPETPGPFQNVTIRLSSYSVDLSTATIRWNVNGKEVLAGTGEISYSIRTGAVGSRTTVEADIYAGSSIAATKTIVIEPGRIDLIWEAVDSYVPPFYKGKALPSSEATIKIVAFPDVKVGNNVAKNASDFSFAWRKNGQNDNARSGYGRNAYTFKTNYLEKVENVELTVSAVKGGYQARESIALRTGDPEIRFYEDIPLEGIQYSYALPGTFYMATQEMNIVAEPYFFSTATDSEDTDLRYAWRINGKTVTSGDRKQFLTLRKAEGGGTATVDVSIESVSRFFQLAKSSLKIEL